MKRPPKTKRAIMGKLKAKGWKLRKKIITGEIWEKGNELLFYDKERKETFAI